MDDYLTMEEIRQRFDGEWVLINQPAKDERRLVVGGRVIAHSKDPDEVSRRAGELPPPINIAIFFIGKPEAEHICL